MGMSDFVLTCEEVFVDEVDAKIGQMETVAELTNYLQHAGHFELIKHMDDYTQIEFVETLWEEYWSSKI